MTDQERIQGELHQLHEQLSEAWWNEEPLEKIQRIENEIEHRRRRLDRRQAVNP